jgi:hypothetical protein
LKPDFWTDEKVVQLTDAAKLLFQGLWNLADREGRLEDKPVSIGFKVRPWDPTRVPELLAELAAIGLIVRYQAEGIDCILVPRLPIHQRMHPREMASKLPPLPDGPRPGRGKARQGEPRHAIAPGSSGSSGSAKPAGPSGPSGPSGSPLPPKPPSARGVEEQRSCSCTRRPCRHEKPLRLVPSAYTGIKRDVRECVVCGAGAEAGIGEGIPGCYACIARFEDYCREHKLERPWEHAEEWAECERLQRIAEASS